jgi:hypothetical protein
MRWLTYADREFLLQTFDTLRRDWKGPDTELLIRLSEWSNRLKPSFGFEHTLTQDVTALSRYLHTHNSDQDVADIARGAMIYVLSADQLYPSRLGDFGLLDEAFVCNYALHEIRLRLGEPATYNPPHLTRDEQNRAETLFLHFIDEPILPDERLIDEVKVFSGRLGNFVSSCLFGRLRKNIEFLSSVLVDVSRTDEHRAYARAALAYIACREDAIDDSFGLVGYLDDYFIAQMVVDFLEPAREPWLELLDATVGVWPFLNQLLIEWKGDVSLPSEYMIINAAVSCAELRGDNTSSIMLITPCVGPTPFLLGIAATLGLIHAFGQLEIKEDSFSPGQKVIVDYSTVAEFAGFETIGDRKMFRLRQVRTQRGEPSPYSELWPLADLRRLTPAPRSRSTRGRLTQNLGRSNVELPSLEYIFNTSRAAQVFGVEKQIIVVTPIASAYEMATSLRLFGHELKDVLPMGHVSTNEEIKLWSKRFGEQDPLLLFVSDLDLACAFVEERQDQCHLIIVDAAGRNTTKTASLRQLQQSHIPTLTLAAERTANDLHPPAENGVSIWEWHEEDFSALLWPTSATGSTAHPIVRYERWLPTRQSTAVETTIIPSPPASQAFEAVRQLRLLARQRGEDDLVELDHIVTSTFRLFSWLLRLATPLTEDFSSTRLIDNHLADLGAVREASLFLSELECTAAKDAEDALRQFFASLRSENKKADHLRELLTGQPKLSIICPDRRLRPDLEHAYADRSARIVGNWDDDDGDLHGGVIPAWFSKDHMAALLIPPMTTPLYLVLYDIEEHWHDDFRRELQKCRTARSARSNRAKFFPHVKGWRKPAPQLSETGDTDSGTSLNVLEEIRQYVQSRYRQHAYRAAKSDGTEAEIPARLVLFDGGVHAFLTESYKANVVTHLLDGVVEDTEEEHVDVKRKTVKELQPGDAVLFHRRSDRDVVRTVADEELAPGVRETALLWQAALKGYVERERITSKQLWERLNGSGCSVSQQTVKEWLTDEDRIAPREYSEHVLAIATVTKDEKLNSRLNNVRDAIGDVFGAHQRASHKIARQVLRRAVAVLKEENHQSRLIEVESNIVLVNVAEIDDVTTQVRVSIVNRLQEPE